MPLMLCRLFAAVLKTVSNINTFQGQKFQYRDRQH